jgi:alpha-glucosidase
VLEFYRRMLAFRRASPALRSGRSRFFDTAEPVLAFQRGEGGEALVCVFNLSSAEVAVAASGCRADTGPAQDARLDGETLILGPNGFAIMKAVGQPSVS